MNIEYLMQHISYQLHTIVRKYSNDRIQQRFFCARMNFEDLLFTLPNVEDFLLHISSQEYPLLSSINDDIIYATVPTPEGLFVIGPICLMTPVYLKHHLLDIPLNPSWKQTLFSCEFNTLNENVLLLFNLFQTQILDKNDLNLFNCIDTKVDDKIQKSFSNLVFNNQENGKKHNPYDQEIREFSSIENGNIDQLEKSWAEDFIGNIGTLATDKVRNLKNVCIVIVTLASRAAIRGGVSPEISFSLSDTYIMKIEETNDMGTLSYLSRDVEYKYTMMVHEIKERQAGILKKGKNPKIDKCKDYIFVHLLEKICLQNIADELQMNPKYLSYLFKQCENITISEFITNEKIKLVKNLLVYSKYSYIEIATYLGFASQSHLGKHFKAATGMTLGQYRQQYGVKEFI